MRPPDPPPVAAAMKLLVDVQNVTVRFRRKRNLRAMLTGGDVTFRAVADADLAIYRQEVVGLVGESGSGKTTLGRTILRLYEPSEGVVVFDGEDITHLREHQLRRVWRHMALVFQDPLSSLNPRHSIRTTLATPLRITGTDGAEIEPRVIAALRRVGLPSDALDRYPHELSGGQLQRAALARALMLSPALVIADEAVSKLDVSVRSQILNLFKDLQADLSIAFLFITHDLHVAAYLCDRIAVMFFGRVVETAPAHELFRAPRHPYTRALLATIDDTAEAPETARRGLVDPEVRGCIYQSQCPRRVARCGDAHPPTMTVGNDHTLACYNSG
ncbi:MAG TPA: ABC transporter ATP-binding protein [Acetobacteraceae bacterium]|jgi:peptide/nickel transport system ATP-binding protein|nr:ABC transporter ATP-binding protein [Acetobacteraceae bacterium]